MKLVNLLVISFLCWGISAQKNLPSDEHLSSGIFAPVQKFTPANQPENHFEDVSSLINRIKDLARYEGDIQLHLSNTRTSKTLTHYNFDLLIEDIKIFGAQVHAAVDADNNIRLIQAPFLQATTADGNFPALQQAEAVKAMIKAENILQTEQIWIYQGDAALAKALRVELSGPETLHREIIFSEGEIIYNNDLHKHLKHPHYGPNDTAVSVRVFDPDPLTTAGKNYGSEYTDNNDKNTGALNTERKLRNTTFSYEDGQFKAKNDFVKITEFSAPATSVAASPSGQFHYTRNKPEFEDVNVVYHITHFSEHLENLGYPGLPGYQIHVDAHALNGADQSFFSTSVYPYRLYFGEGGVDDAEDADVILHEFSHAVLYEAAAGGSKSTERKCIEEAICDYFAVSYSRSISSFNADKVFNWDGHNEFWSGRETSSNTDYQNASFKNGNYYTHTDLMADALLEIYDQLGRALTDQLVLEAIYNLNGTSTMPDMAHYLLMSDSLLNNGANIRVISSALQKKGMVPEVISIEESSSASAGIEVFNTYGFARDGSPVQVRAKESLQSYDLYNLKGELVHTRQLQGAREIEIAPQGLSTGMYLLRLTTLSGQNASFKIHKGGY